MGVLFALCGIWFLTKNTSIAASFGAFYRAVTQFPCTRVWHRDPFGVSIALLDIYMLKLEANRSSVGEWVADLRAAIEPQSTAV